MRSDESKFLENLIVLKRGSIKVASSQLPGKDAVTKQQVKKVLKTFEKSKDVPKQTLDQYKQRAELDPNSKSVAQDFFNELKKKRSEVQKIELTTAKCLRQTGIFKISSKNVYEDVETGDFWKISDDGKNVLRLFKEVDGVAETI